MIVTLRDAVVQLAELGGPVVLLLVGLSVVVLTVTIYKLWQFAAAGVGRHRALQDAIAAWDAGDGSAARQYLETSRSYLVPVFAMALDGPQDAARLEAEAEARFSRLEGGFRLLDSVAQLAPLLGLFGTVLGMISAFQALQEAGAQVDPSVLAGGIWVALLTTAVGLAVAMPTSVILSWFEARMDADRLLAQKGLRTILAPSRRHDGKAAQAQPIHA
ncbi:MotA/TolQ/ExbB proton channel family protein [Lutimaribacter sp. EGI FJ00015]|uniref:MotA/TolQ/ExbB proton channel family protein n=1 Tax=Lutimaribacter degradans TaxID=2945989 RepID=A0ACC5ZXV4_9RHOB|nr:MotA/TolQ/ExbB proton channel family protein [Lutimaribacter sp. EGI FJ00013]MCM2563179.1 MotA/TolQ/ExbB proton channel family protein [Lutimaribacter sp. EGI FJ00013]MCO0614358.1 MotA/TolQ/ExbB proton channel family protein [Lutimaribacter sp. EGI FJ00015]MCO0637168.1 MotA/TolQ/ExbB proton channel family protein [Lutimaribacter sp. EGI FJ00014]